VSMPGTGVYLRTTTCNGDFVGNPPGNSTCNVGSVTCGLQNPANLNSPTVVTGCAAAGAVSIDVGGTGTSAAAPLWAGFTALVNQSNALNGAPAIGFANPTLYGISQNAALYAASFHDVSNRVGEVQAGCLANFHAAGPGYDLVTGLGSPTCALITQLANRTPTLALTANAVGTGNVAAPVNVTGSGIGFTPGGSAVGFTLSGVPAGDGTALPSADLGDDVRTDANGDFTFNLTSNFFPPAVLCTAAQESQVVTLTAHDRAAFALNGTDVSASATFPASLFCAEVIAPNTDFKLSQHAAVLVQDTFPGHPGPLAIDGDATTYWGSVDMDNQDFITVDLKTPRLIHRISVLWGVTRFATAYQVQTSNDNSTWSTLQSFNIHFGDRYDVSNLNVTARFVRVFMTESSNLPPVGGFSVEEFEVWGPPGLLP